MYLVPTLRAGTRDTTETTPSNVAGSSYFLEGTKLLVIGSVALDTLGNGNFGSAQFFSSAGHAQKLRTPAQRSGTVLAMT